MGLQWILTILITTEVDVVANLHLVGGYPSSGSGSKKHKKEKKCRSYSFVTKNPYDVGITKSLSGGEFLVLLSGNHHATTDFDRDRLPDWIAIGERPCRQYKNLTTEELVEFWGLKKKACN